MSKVYISADSWKDSGQTVEPSYFYGPGPTYGPPVEFDSAGDGEGGAGFWSASNTRGVFVWGVALYKMLQRDFATSGTPHLLIAKSTNDGLTWNILDSTNSPVDFGVGHFDNTTAKVYCALSVSGSIVLHNFDLTTETWGTVYGASGAPVVDTGTGDLSIRCVWLRPNNTLLVMYSSKVGFPLGTGFGGATYDFSVSTWSTPFDCGANIIGLTGWDAGTGWDSISPGTFQSSVMDANGIVHFFFETASLRTSPVIWGNRCFYQAINLDNSLGSFYDFPGQVAPLYMWNGTTPMQDLTSYTASPMGKPAIVGDIIVLPVLNVNKSPSWPAGDPWPQQLANVYIGTPVSAPVWIKDSTKTIDPDALIIDPINYTNEMFWPQEAPFLSFNGTTIYGIFPSQDYDGQNEARLRLCQTTNLASPANGWTSATVFDVQVDASPSGFNFSTQVLIAPTILAPLVLAAALTEPWFHLFT
jgi:hypothetical protein